MIYHRGQELVCIVGEGKATQWFYFWAKFPLTKGAVYHFAEYAGQEDGIKFLYLEEFPDTYFQVEMFRPVRKTEAGMSILRKLLLPTKVKEDA